MPPKPLPPRPRSEKWWGSLEEHNAWVRENFARWKLKEEPRPCDCGYWEPGEWLASCREVDRPRCHATAQKRLQEDRKRDQAAAAREKRRWPGPEPHHDAAKGHCRWCGEPILRDDGVRLNLRRTRHAECLTQYLCRVQPQTMRWFVFRRDKGRCADCGRVHESVYGHWEADHERALYFANGDPAYWAPENVVIRCKDPCHKIKTAADMKLIAADRRARKEAAGEPE